MYAGIVAITGLAGLLIFLSSNDTRSKSANTPEVNLEPVPATTSKSWRDDPIIGDINQADNSVNLTQDDEINQIEIADDVQPSVAKEPTFKERYGDQNIIRPSANGAAAAKRYREEHKAKRMRAARKRNLRRENELAQQQQRLQHYLSVVVPQQRKAAQENFDRTMKFRESMQRDQMIQLQRDQNFILRQQLWNQELQQGRQPVYYGVPPYGIDMRYP